MLESFHKESQEAVAFISYVDRKKSALHSYEGALLKLIECWDGNINGGHICLTHLVTVVQSKL